MNLSDIIAAHRKTEKAIADAGMNQPLVDMLTEDWKATASVAAKLAPKNLSEVQFLLDLSNYYADFVESVPTDGTDCAAAGNAILSINQNLLGYLNQQLAA